MAQDIDAVALNIEVARDNLAATLDEIAGRLSPDRLKTQAKDSAVNALQQPNVQIALGVVVGLVVLTAIVKAAKK